MERNESDWSIISGWFTRWEGREGVGVGCDVWGEFPPNTQCLSDNFGKGIKNGITLFSVVSSITGCFPLKMGHCLSKGESSSVKFDMLCVHRVFPQHNLQASTA